MGVLHILQETAWLVFLLEYCMSLLMVSDKPTLHLVIPILEGLKTILQSPPCTDFTTDEAKAMIKLIMFELNEGCLSIDKPEYKEYKDYCYIAAYLFPETDNLVTEETLSMAKEKTKEYFDQLYNEKTEYQDLGCNQWDVFNDNFRSRDNRAIPSRDLF